MRIVFYNGMYLGLRGIRVLGGSRDSEGPKSPAGRAQRVQKNP